MVRQESEIREIRLFSLDDLPAPFFLSMKNDKRLRFTPLIGVKRIFRSFIGLFLFWVEAESEALLP